MKYIMEYNKNGDKIADILNYLETWEDEYNDFKFKLKEYKVLNVLNVERMSSFKSFNIKGPGVIISSEFILPEILWKDQYDRVRTHEDIRNYLNIYKRIDTLFKRLELMDTYPIYTDATFLAQRLKSISIKIFISSNSL